MRRVLLAFSLLLCFSAAHAQSPDGSFILPYIENTIGTIGITPNAFGASGIGVMTLSPQTSTSGDFFALKNGVATNGGGRMLVLANGGQVYALGADGPWFQYNGISWSSVSPPVTADGTLVTNPSVLVSSIGLWGFGLDALTGGNEIQLNGMPTGVAASTLENLNGIVYAKDTNTQWWQQVGWTKTADPNSYAVPQTITAAFLASNFHSTFSDNFSSLNTIAPNGTYGSTFNWYNGTEQCCMSPTPQPGNVGGAMFPTVVGLNGPYNPYSLTGGSGPGLTMTMHTETATDSTHTYTSVFSGVTTSIASNGQGFTQQYGYFEATMQFSPNVGTWPAFWMLSPSRNMEIDVTEYYRGNGHAVGHYFATFHDYANGILFGPNEVGGTTDLSTGFHTYGVLIDAGHISFYLDRQLMASSATPPNAKQPMFMLFDQGSGGGWPTCAGPSQVGVNPPPSGTSCSQGSAQLEGALLQIQSINVWQHN